MSAGTNKTDNNKTEDGKANNSNEAGPGKVSEAQAGYAAEKVRDSSLSGRIRYLLERTGKAELSRMAGVSETQVYRYTTGENEPSIGVAPLGGRHRGDGGMAVEWQWSGV